MTVTFFGHRNTPSDIGEPAEKLLMQLIEEDGADDFLVGSEGNFDRMIYAKLKKLQKKYPQIKVKIVPAHMPTSMPSTARERENFSDTVLPEEIAVSHPRYAINKRNEWMISRADTVVTYVQGVTGGAAKYKQYAEKKGKTVINLADLG